MRKYGDYMNRRWNNSYKKNSVYVPRGSDDGYDYYRDNRDGSVDDYVQFVEEYRKSRENQTPKNEG